MTQEKYGKSQSPISGNSAEDRNIAENTTEKATEQKKAQSRKILNRDFQKMSSSRMIFSGLVNLILLVICFWIHWSLGVLFAIFWLFVLPYLDMRRLRKYEAENPSILPKSDDFDDTPFFDAGESRKKEEARDQNWKSWDDWDDWKKDEDSEETSQNAIIKDPSIKDSSVKD